MWEGKEVVKMGRVMLGATKPQESAPGTIRGDFAIDVGRYVEGYEDNHKNSTQSCLCLHRLWTKFS